METEIKVLGKERPYKGRESSLQIACCKYLQLRRLLYLHPPNEGVRDYKYACILKAMGVKSGAPDIIILEPKGKFHGLMVELKAGKNRPTSSQTLWLAELQKRGYQVAIVYNFLSFKKLVDDYLSGE